MKRKLAVWTWLIASTIGAHVSAAPTLGFGNASGTTPIYVGQSPSVEVPLFLTLDAPTPISAIFANIQVGLLVPPPAPQPPAAGTPLISNTTTSATLFGGAQSITLGGPSLLGIEANQFGIGGVVLSAPAVPIVPAGTYDIGSIDLDTSAATAGNHTLSLVATGITNGRSDLADSEIFTESSGAFPVLPGVVFESRNLRIIDLDFDNSGTIDAVDLQMIIDHDGSTSHPELDINGDGTVEYNVGAPGVISSDSDIFVRTLVETEYGDSNFDLAVNAIDVSRLSGGFGTNGLYSQGDFNGDGDVGPADVSVLSAYFGFNNNPASLVPEPNYATTIAFVVCVVPGYLRSRHLVSGNARKNQDES